MARKKFWEIFRENPNGSLTPVHTIDVNGVVFTPQVSIGPGLNFGGLDFHYYKNLDIAIDEKEGKWIVQGFYK